MQKTYKCICAQECWVASPTGKRTHYLLDAVEYYEECPRHFEPVKKNTPMKAYDDDILPIEVVEPASGLEQFEGMELLIAVDGGAKKPFIVTNGQLVEKVDSTTLPESMDFANMTEENLNALDEKHLPALREFIQAAYNVAVHPRTGLVKLVGALVEARKVANPLS